MSDTAVIREFLVALGFKQDEAALKRFQAGIDAATKAVFGLAAALEGTALATAIAITKLASNLETIYFASRRVGASEKNLLAFQKTAENLGVSASEAQGSLEGLATFLRKNPGGESWLRSFGVETRDAKGQLLDITQLAVNIGRAFQKMPVYLSEQLSAKWGFSEKLMLALRSGSFEKEFGAQRALLKDSEVNAAAAAAHRYEVALRNLETRLDSIKIKLGNGVFRALLPELDKIGNWVDAHADQINSFLTSFVHGMTVAASIITPILGKIAEGWKNIFDWVAAFGRWINEHLPRSISDRIGKGVDWLFRKLDIKAPIDAALDTNGAPPGVRNNNPGNLEFAGQKGATKNGRWASFTTPEAGLDALGRQLMLDYSRGLTSIRKIIEKYAPKNENNTEAYIEDIARSIGFKPDEELKFGNRIVLAQMMRAMAAHEVGVKYAPSRQAALASAERVSAGTSNLNVTANTTVNVVSPDPDTAAQETARAQHRVTAEITRSAVAIVQ